MTKKKQIIFYNKNARKQVLRWYDEDSFLNRYSRYNQFVAVTCFDDPVATVDYLERVMIEDEVVAVRLFLH